MKGRANGLRVSGGSPPYDYSTIYWYDSRGRLNRLSGSGTPWNYVNYLYLADSDLVEKIEYRGPPQEGGYAFVAGVIRTFEPNRDLVTSVENKWDSTTVSKYEYTNDALGRRTSVTVSGTAFSAAGTTGFDLYTYNDRNELTSALRYAGGTISNPTDPVYARHFEYAYDPIGNRETYEVSQGTATTYTTNELNQYTATANPSESFTYDDDGNLTQDGTYTYVWDAENRLIDAYPTNPTSGSQKCVMVYDYMNRRVKRSLHDWTGSAWSGTPAESRVFLYDGWNVLLSYNPAASMAIDREFTWGLDMSGQNGNPSVAGIHGAGGIGGLVAARRSGSPTKAYFCFYDANGNLSDCVKNSDGTPWTHVEYDPYGGQIVASDAGALGHPFRYSTKYWDEQIAKYYYGFRYLDYRQGRWSSRDPIRELGTVVLAAIATNGAISRLADAAEEDEGNHYDYLRSSPANAIDPFGLEVDYLHRGCCNGRSYDVTKKCCEERKVVDKVTIWQCARPADVHPNPWGIIKHCYVCCDGPHMNCYSKGPHNTQPGKIDPEKDHKTGTCYAQKVCPHQKDRKCKNPTTSTPYHWYFNNCCAWAYSDTGNDPIPQDVIAYP